MSVNIRENICTLIACSKNGLHDKQQLFRSIAGLFVVEFNRLLVVASKANGNVAFLNGSGVRVGHLRGDECRMG